MLYWCVLYQYFLIWLFVPLVNNAIRGYYDVMKETEWLRNRMITNISYSSSAALSSCMVVITQRIALILPRTTPSFVASLILFRSVHVYGLIEIKHLLFKNKITYTSVECLHIQYHTHMYICTIPFVSIIY